MEMAIRESLIKEGCDEKYAEVEAGRAMVHSEKRAEKLFDGDAENCFTQSAKEKRRVYGRVK